MSDPRRGLGQRGEELAVQALKRQGYEIMARNWRCAVGEIDVVARHGDELVIVEVRTRRGYRFGMPEDSITSTKQAKLVELGYTYVGETGWEGPWRIDVVAVQMDQRGHLERITVLPNAIEG
ncbi:MAG TPA: YraN family protein [Anaerolineae bacterium]|nr:YraN family protein [Anaerolineae bacterium]HIQ04974.1 YraN family protein [Anaerolineae bacterium]